MILTLSKYKLDVREKLHLFRFNVTCLIKLSSLNWFVSLEKYCFVKIVVLNIFLKYFFKVRLYNFFK